MFKSISLLLLFLPGIFYSTSPPAPTEETFLPVVEISPVTLENGNTVTAKFAMKNFTDVIAMQFSMEWDETLLDFQSVQSFNLPGLGQSNFGLGQTGDGIATVAWVDATSTGVTLPNCDIIFSITFLKLGGSVPPILITGTPTAIELVDVNFNLLTLQQTTSCLCTSLFCNANFAVAPDPDCDYTINLTDMLDPQNLCVGDFNMQVIQASPFLIVADGPPPLGIPASYGGGSFFVSLTEATFGNSCSGTVHLEPGLLCNPAFDLSPAPNGIYVLQIDDILDPLSPCPGAGQFSVEVRRSTNNQLVAAGFLPILLPATYVGETLIVKLTEAGSGATCSGLANLLEPPCQHKPEGQHVDMRNRNVVRFIWGSVPQTVACTTQVRESNTGRVIEAIIHGVSPDNLSFPSSLFRKNWIYYWQVKCACKLRPLDETPWSDIQGFRYIPGTYR